jgi:aspartate/methionine/tyrosine aminotransferase
VRPRAGSVAFPELLEGDVDDFAARLVQREGVLILPASQFGYPGNHFRLGFGRRDMPEALGILERFARNG